MMNPKRGKKNHFAVIKVANNEIIIIIKKFLLLWHDNMMNPVYTSGDGNDKCISKTNSETVL